jgi:hypothetical protein
VRAPALAAITADYQRAATALSKARQPGWTEFLRASARAGDLDASRLLASKIIDGDIRHARVRQSQPHVGRVLTPDDASMSQPTIQTHTAPEYSPAQLLHFIQQARQRDS